MTISPMASAMSAAKGLSMKGGRRHRHRRGTRKQRGGHGLPALSPAQAGGRRRTHRKRSHRRRSHRKH